MILYNFVKLKYIAVVEIINPSLRAYAGPVFFIISTVGYVTLGSVAWLIRDWRILLRVLHPIGFVSILHFWIVPESSRWLLSKGKHEKVGNILRKIVRINQTKLPDDMQDVIDNRPKHIRQDQENNGASDDYHENKFSDIFKHPKFCFRIIACALCWTTNILIYYGLSYTSVGIGGNKFLNYILVSLADTPGQIVTILFVDKIGRKKMIIITFFLSGISLMISAFIGNIYWLRLVLYLIGKCAIGSAFSTTYIFTSEFLPTFMRHRVFGLCSSFGRIGAIVASQALALQDIYKPLPAILFASMALMSGAMSFTFPETVNCPLPETIQEAMQMGTKNSYNSNVKNLNESKNILEEKSEK